MSNKAQVNRESVQAFQTAVSEAHNFAAKIQSNGITCIDQMIQVISDRLSTAADILAELKAAKASLTIKKAKYHAKVAELQIQLASLKAQRIFQSKEEKANCEHQIKAVESELNENRRKLDHAKALEQSVDSQIQNVASAQQTLEEKKETCRKMKDRLEEIKRTVEQKSSGANDNLVKILQIIDEYIQTKITFESIAF